MPGMRSLHEYLCGILLPLSYDKVHTAHNLTAIKKSE